MFVAMAHLKVHTNLHARMGLTWRMSNILQIAQTTTTTAARTTT